MSQSHAGGAFDKDHPQEEECGGVGEADGFKGADTTN